MGKKWERQQNFGTAYPDPVHPSVTEWPFVHSLTLVATLRITDRSHDGRRSAVLQPALDQQETQAEALRYVPSTFI